MWGFEVAFSLDIFSRGRGSLQLPLTCGLGTGMPVEHSACTAPWLGGFPGQLLLGGRHWDTKEMSTWKFSWQRFLLGGGGSSPWLRSGFGLLHRTRDTLCW